jgi:hypothetical protein
VSDNSHLFKKGQKRPPNSGRKKGTPNKVSPMLKEALLLAAESVGDTANQDGLADYLTWLAAEHPPAFASLLNRMLACEVRRHLAAQRSQARPD